MKCEYPVNDDFRTTLDPEEILDRTVSYADLMNKTDPPDAIVASSWTSEGDVTIVDDSVFTDETATVRITDGGKYNSYSKVMNLATGASGRKYKRTIHIWVRPK